MARADTQDLSLEPPLAPAFLDRLRLDLRGRPPSDAMGAHLHRKMGHSLEFREYIHYEPGADIRTVDWAASSRQGFDGSAYSTDKLLARSFEAETQRRLIILLDMRPAMRLPEAAPKSLIGYWIAACLTEAALQEADQVIFCPMFDQGMSAPIKISGRRGVSEVRKRVGRSLARPLADSDWERSPKADLRAIAGLLVPTTAVVLISDMLFDDANGRISEFARRAQRSYRSFHVIEIDSWPHEAELLLAQPFSLGNLEGRSFEGGRFSVTDEFVSAARTEIEKRKGAFRRAMRGPGLVWPERAFSLPRTDVLTKPAVESWFRSAFKSAAFLPSLMSRVSL